MATGEETNLTDGKIERLARELEARKMETVAIADLGISIETVNNLKQMSQFNCIAFIRDLLVQWRNKNPGTNQVQRLGDILYAVAKEGGYVDPHKIERILGVPNTSNYVAATRSTTGPEFLVIAEKFKPHVERRMKIEPFPWLRTHSEDMSMEELYTDLTLMLKKISDNNLKQEIKLKNIYEATLTGGDSRNRRVKILIKADPGMGKTTLGKKITWDWAREEFRDFSVVFFVLLKFVQPHESIEEMVANQNPELEGLGVSSEKLQFMLGRFSDRCLLILDGLDEIGPNQNQDVLKLIRNQKLLDLSVLVTSRPHSTNDVETYFSTIVQVDGFNLIEAEKFVRRIIGDLTETSAVMLFQPLGLQKEFSVQTCPILLSFLCLLVKEGEIDLSDKKISIGDIYTHLVQCLYKKYTRDRMEYEAEDFLQVMKSVGKLALKTLISNKPLLRRKEVGEFAFEYGLFAGHEDIRVWSDPAADFYVTYSHRSLEEFFGSFGFVESLSEGKAVEDIMGSKDPIFVMNPLVLRFCLWFLSTSVFDFSQGIKSQCFNKLTSYVAKCIDSSVLDTEEICNRYPALDILALEAELEMNFLHEVLNKCTHITTLQMSKSNEVHFQQFLENTNKLLGTLNRDFIDKLTRIFIGDFKPTNLEDNSLIVSIDSTFCDGCKMLDLLLPVLAQRNPQVYLRISPSSDAEWDLTALLSEYIKQLHMVNISHNATLQASGEIPNCPILTHITAKGNYVHVDQSVAIGVWKAVRRGKLPCLRRIEIINCCLCCRYNWPTEVEVSLKHNN